MTNITPTIHPDMTDDQIWDALEPLIEIAASRGWLIRAWDRKGLTETFGANSDWQTVWDDMWKGAGAHLWYGPDVDDEEDDEEGED